MKTLVRHSAFLALIGLTLFPLVVAHASPSPADSVHFTGDLVGSPSFSPDGTLLAIGVNKRRSDGNWEGLTSLWDVASRQQVATLDRELVWSLSFSPDGTLLAIGGGGETRLWDVASRQQVATLQHEDWDVALSFSPDGTLLATGGYKVIRLWDVASRQQVATLQHEDDYWVNWLSFSPDGTLLATRGYNSDGDKAIGSLWDVASRQQVATFQQDGVNWLSFSPDGTLLAIVVNKRRSDGSWAGETRLWDVASRQQVATFWFRDWVWSPLFSPDGTLLAIGLNKRRSDGSWAGETRLWDVASRQQVATLQHGGWVWSPLFSPDGTLLAIGGGGETRLWDVASRQQVATFQHEDDYWVDWLLFSPDGTLLAIVINKSISDGNWDGVIRLWDVSKWKRPHPSGLVNQPESEGQPTTTVELEGISISHNSVREDDGQATTITLTVTLDKAARADETITFAIVRPTEGKTAKRNEDFDATFPETITIARGQRTGTAQLTLTPKDNTTADGDKAFAVQATSASGHSALIDIKIIDNDSAGEPQARLMPDPAEVAFDADDPAWKTFTVHTNLDSVLVRANPSGSDPAIEVAGGQQVPTRDYCPAEGNDRPTRGRRDGYNLHVKACQAGQTKILLISYDTGEVLQQYEVNVEASTSASATTALNPSYPNPFNSETVLSYTLPTASDIRLEVFTLNGQRVAVLHEGFQAAGYHTIALDASAWASGVYLYRLTTPEGRFAQKFTLLR